MTIHKSQGLSLDRAIIDLSSLVFEEGMAYVALSRVRSLSGVHLTAFSPTSIMASRTCVEEVNRLRQKYRLDLPTYDLPAKKSGKRKMTGTVDHVPPKKLRLEETVSKGVKRKHTDQQTDTPAKHPKNGPQHAGQSKRNFKTSEQLIQSSNRDPRDFDPRTNGTWNTIL